MELSQQYNFKESEKKWIEYWQKEGIYKFDPKNKKKIYSVDTPPPTVSGRMHIGHAFSYSQQDFVVRYHRMKGENVYFPFGTDDNGLPTERMVEKLKNVRSVNMPRDEFVKLCEKTIGEIKDDFIQDWKNIGMSCDFSTTYSTIDKHCIKTSQKSFIELYKNGLVYQRNAPTMWCVNCQTAIAQAELEDRELESSFNDVNFELEDGKKLIIATTRPELIGACVMIYVHPDDKRYKNIIGKKVKISLFNYHVKVYADESADPTKGSGAMMVCSYGDKYDVEAINKRKLEPRVLFTKDGRLNELAGKYKGMKIREARKAILEDLEKEGYLASKKSIKHIVNVHDKCGIEIEFLASKQWFIKVLDKKKELLNAGKKIKWHPASMKSRYDNWVSGLNWDWCISRQRHFGVPFPLWYCNKCNEILLADEKDIPVDPLSTKPKKKCKCGNDNFNGETDVMDTWATSSLTPQIVLDWVKDKIGHYKDVNFEKMYSMSLRPQAHDIIRTWAFYTIVKGLYHNKKIPWENIVISGHIQDPHGRKMSKSLGNVIEPKAVLDKYGADAWRFLAATSKLGEDMPYQEKELVTGQRTVTKLWNASKFTLMHLKTFDSKLVDKNIKLELIDRWLLTKLNKLVKCCTESFEDYEYSKTRLDTEIFFWHTFCDNYLEVVKDRLYNAKRGGEAKIAAQYTLYRALLTVLKLFAPIMPFITEEIYHSYFVNVEKLKSVHVSEWPKYNKKEIDDKAERIGDLMVSIISEVRQFKTKNQKSLKEPVILTLDKRNKKEFGLVLDDLKAVTNAKEIKFGDKLEISF